MAGFEGPDLWSEATALVKLFFKSSLSVLDLLEDRLPS